MNSLEGKKVAVLGLGIEGLSSARFLVDKGAEVTVLDKREEVREDIKILRYKDIKIKIGEEGFEDLNEYDFVVRSPGIKLSKLSLEPSKITSHIKLFFDLCPAKIIGVTGTKGKGTTASLIYEMLKNEGKDVYLGGNIGVAPLDFLDKLTPQSWVVLELSSFQLQDLTKSPHISVLLMTTQEHLVPDKGMGKFENYHEDIYEYIDAKRAILKFQTKNDFAVINRDYPASHESDIHTEGSVFQVSRERETAEDGCFVRDGKIYLRILGKLGEPVNQNIRKSENQTSSNVRGSESSKFSEVEIIDVKEILLPGGHNLENVCAAVMASLLAGVSKKHIVSVLKSFKGLEHRLELIQEVNGVKYYDDSFSTTPETAIAAILAFKSPEILILGGASKGANFEELGKVITEAKNIKAIIGIGIEWRKIKAQFIILNSQFILIEGAKDMKQIVAAASKIAKSGDVVLLSPACSSFDMFKNYKDRGEQFKKEVLKLRN